MNFLDQPTRNVFFTGKGGVGKTSLACAAALALADRGRRVLLVSTDPASNLDEALGARLGPRPTSVAGADGLWAMNIDPAAAAAAYRERILAPYRNVLPAEAVASMEEQFSGSCTLEIAAFDEFAKLLGDPRATAQFDHVIFDTAPTGHTLRLLSLPSAWTGFLENNTTGTSCLGPLAGLEAQRAYYEGSVKALADGALTTLALVARPEMATLVEAERTSQELAALGVANQHLAINGVFQAAAEDDPIALAFQRRTEEALSQLPSALAPLPRTLIPLASRPLIGIEALRSLGRSDAAKSAPCGAPSDLLAMDGESSLSGLIDELAQSGRGVILTMGKGGVGKTTLAAAIAVALADRGFPVTLSTTDPAAHVAQAIQDELPGLGLSRIDPVAEVAAYTEEVMRTAGRELDEAGRALLAEDLRSPCTEEIAVFRAFARTVDGGEAGFVVLDTAPTGHTILLLDAALAHHREVSRQAAQLPPEVEALLPRLRNADFTRVLLVTLPEATPVHEAAQLQSDLRRAGIEPFAWVVNQALTHQGLRDPVLRCRQREQQTCLREVAEALSRRTAIVPWQAEPPQGAAALRRLTETNREPLTTSP